MKLILPDRPSPMQKRTTRPVPILTYHSLDRSGSVISVAPETFAHQIAILRDQGFQGIRLSDLLSAWDGKTTLPVRPIVITFDDGFANVLESGVPVLENAGFTATIFPVAGYTGQTNNWPSRPSNIPHMPLLTWADLRELAKRGFEIGGHTLTHMPLPCLTADEMKREIVQSKHLLEGRLARPVTTFAYPYGLISSASRRIVAEHYRGAGGVKLGVAHPQDDRYLLKRVDVYYVRALPIFRLLETHWGKAYLWARQWGRTLCGVLKGPVRVEGTPEAGLCERRIHNYED